VTGLQVNWTLRCRYNLKKLTYEQRKASLVERLNALNSSAGADVDEDDDE
jgi:large subunit ribosomal protein L5e